MQTHAAASVSRTGASFYQRQDFAMQHGLKEPQVYQMLRLRLIEVVSGFNGAALAFAGGMTRDQAVQTYLAQVGNAEPDDSPNDDTDLANDEPALESCPTLWM